MHLIIVPWLRARSGAERGISAQQVPPTEQRLHTPPQPIDGRYPIAPVRPAPRSSR